MTTRPAARERARREQEAFLDAVAAPPPLDGEDAAAAQA